ncbi:MAG TPA: site-specific DNA-methyltransferase [Candidatus Paceibacterota bacterium]|nr:site-specific DNA-methyltransferase [Verrucomicrobiota bacterium]HSA11584.1 site-specific DNA-methyltransferase [Candidatus Paceibacterota bacterium]
MLSEAEYQDKVICGDSAQVLARLPDCCIHLIVTSPPYDLQRTYHNFKGFDFEAIAKQLYRVACEGGVVVWIVNDATVNGSETGTSMRQALYFMDIGFRLHDTMIHEKCGANFPDRVRYWQAWEYMFVLSKGKPRVVNLIADRRNIYAGQKTHGCDRLANGGFKPKVQGRLTPEFGPRFNVWKICHNKRGRFDHPASFAPELARDHIASWSSIGDTVLDCFAGSGTTLCAAKALGRHFLGVEISPEYCKLAESRLAETKAPERQALAFAA